MEVGESELGSTGPHAGASAAASARRAEVRPRVCLSVGTGKAGGPSVSEKLPRPPGISGDAQDLQVGANPARQYCPCRIR